MGKLFGTDGIRGVANETLDAKLAYRVGQAAAISLCDDCLLYTSCPARRAPPARG